MAETEVKSINGRALCDNKAREDIAALNKNLNNSEYVTESELAAKRYAKQSDVESLSEEIANLPNGNGVVHNAIGATFPPVQKPADAEFDGYDIDIYNSMADDVFSYIDAVVSNKDTVTKEILGKDGSGQYDIARYIYANREYYAWKRQNYPKMYAWKNGSNIRYSTSISPRIGENLYDKTNLDSGGTIIETTTIPAQAALIKDKRYSLSGGAFSTASGKASIIIPLPKNITSN